jgi:hypothetical protein
MLVYVLAETFEIFIKYFDHPTIPIMIPINGTQLFAI